MALQLSPQEDKAVSRSVARPTVGESATWGTSLLKTEHTRLGLHWDFIIAFLNPTAPAHALLSVDGCQVIERYKQGTRLHHLADVFQLFLVRSVQITSYIYMQVIIFYNFTSLSYLSCLFRIWLHQLEIPKMFLKIVVKAHLFVTNLTRQFLQWLLFLSHQDLLLMGTPFFWAMFCFVRFAFLVPQPFQIECLPKNK